MALSNEQKVKIEEIVKAILLSRMDNFPDLGASNRNAPFHEAFLKAFKNRLRPLNIDIPYLIAISSWLHGLNTSLGTGFENLAHIISGGYKRSFSKAFTLKVKEKQAKNIEEIIRDLKLGTKTPDLRREDNIIFDFKSENREVNSLPFTVDNYVEKEDTIEAIELKSVRPNSGEARGEKQKILYAKAAFRLLNRDKKIKFFIAFPFDPTSDNPTTYNKERFFNYLIEFKKFFSPDEVLIGPELWDYLSKSENTMEEILDTIAEVIEKLK